MPEYHGRSKWGEARKKKKNNKDGGRRCRSLLPPWRPAELARPHVEFVNVHVAAVFPISFYSFLQWASNTFSNQQNRKESTSATDTTTKDR